MRLRAPLSLSLAALAVALPLVPTSAQAQTAPSPSPSAAACPRLVLSAPEEEGNVATRVGGSIRLRGASSDPGSSYRLEVTSPYTGPIRSGAGTETLWDVKPNENTRLRLRSTVPGQYTCLSNSLQLYVEPSVTMSATRVGTREFAFTGRVLPGRQQQVTVYRLDSAGRPVLTAQGRVAGDGTYEIRRSFTGTGTFDFYAAVPASATNLAGRSVSRTVAVR